MPEVVSVLIPWLRLLCPVLLSFSHPSAKKNEAAEVYLFPEIWVADWKHHKECRGWISQILRHATEAIAHFFLMRWKLFSDSDRRFPWVETTGYNFIFLLKYQHRGIAFRIEICEQIWSLYLGISLFWYIQIDGLSLTDWMLSECIVKYMI